MSFLRRQMLNPAAWSIQKPQENWFPKRLPISKSDRAFLLKKFALAGIVLNMLMLVLETEFLNKDRFILRFTEKRQIRPKIMSKLFIISVLFCKATVQKISLILTVLHKLAATKGLELKNQLKMEPLLAKITNMSANLKFFGQTKPNLSAEFRSVW